MSALEKELEELENNMIERSFLADGKWSLSLDSTWESWCVRRSEILKELKREWTEINNKGE